jgi:hypothetical protein
MAQKAECPQLHRTKKGSAAREDGAAAFFFPLDIGIGAKA